MKKIKTNPSPEMNAMIDEVSEAEAHLAGLDKAEILRVLNKTNYHALLPANIRYDKSLSHVEKMVYAGISALLNSNGNCYATNSWFSETFGNSEKTIERAIKKLRSAGYITTLTENIGGISLRKMWVSDPSVVLTEDNESRSTNDCSTNYKLLSKASEAGLWSTTRNHRKNDNSLYTIGKENATTIYTLPIWLGKSTYHRLVSLYELMWEYTFKVRPQRISVRSQSSAIIKRLYKSYGESTSALIIILHFEWHGMSGINDRTHKDLFNNGFPVSWIPNSASLYESFIKNVLLISNDAEAEVKITEVLTKVTKV